MGNHKQGCECPPLLKRLFGPEIPDCTELKEEADISAKSDIQEIKESLLELESIFRELSPELNEIKYRIDDLHEDIIKLKKEK